MTDYTTTSILLTGATGSVGRHVLYELLAQYAQGRRHGRLAVLIRPNATQTAAQRLRGLITHKFIPNYLKAYASETLLNFVEVIEADLTQLQTTDLHPLGTASKWHIIHSAASTNLGRDAQAETEIKRLNYLATLRLWEVAQPYAQKFIFISTAFSSGHRVGRIDDAYLQLAQRQNRNPYESYKTKAEQEISTRSQAAGIDWQILRPSIVSGRLLDKPLYYTPSFNVFYAFGKFFHALDRSPLGNERIRIKAPNAHVTGLNIIPVDYVAKAIVRVFERGDIKELNIAHSKIMSHSLLVQKMLSDKALQHLELVEQLSNETASRAERLYNKTVGAQLGSYIDTPEHSFDVRRLRSILADIQEPDVEQNFDSMFAFAVQNEFEAQ